MASQATRLVETRVDSIQENQRQLLEGTDRNLAREAVQLAKEASATASQCLQQATTTCNQVPLVPFS